MNDQHHGAEARHDESDQNEGPARHRRGKLICFLLLAARRLAILLLRWIVVLALQGKVWLFVPLQFGGSRLGFGYIFCHAGSYGLAKRIRGGTVRTGSVTTTTIRNTVKAPRIRKVSLVDKIAACCSTAWRKASRLFGPRGCPSGSKGVGYWGSPPLLWSTRQRSWPA